MKCMITSVTQWRHDEECNVCVTKSVILWVTLMDCDTLYRSFHLRTIWSPDIECTDSSCQFMTAAQPRPEYHVLEGSPL